MPRSVLLLTLRVFSATGGIEKVCRVLCAAFNELAGGQADKDYQVFSMYDRREDVDEKYVEPGKFRGFHEDKLGFVKAALSEGRKKRVVMLSHINLLSIGFLIKLLAPSTRLVLFAHGIEVWKPLSILRRLMLKKCDRVLAVSNFTREKIIEVHGIPADRVAVLNNCLDPFLPAPLSTGKDEELLQRYGLEKQNFILLTLSRLSSKELYKGYDHVLYALKDLKAEYPQIRYLIIGNYDEAEKKRLDGIIAELCLQQQVSFTGYIPDEELARHFSLADLYVMPSKKEGFGISFIEAMHYRLPVIGGNKDGTSDALLNGQLGIQVNPDDIEDLEDAIRRVIMNRNAFVPDAGLLQDNFGFPVYKKRLREILQRLPD